MSGQPVESMVSGEDSGAAVVRTSVRPVLIASRRTLMEQSTFLRHLLVGLVTEPVSTVLICPSRCNVESIAPAPVTVLPCPWINLPVLEYLCIDHLADQLAKLRPTILHGLSESGASLVRRLADRLDLPYVLTVNKLVRRFGRPTISPRRCMTIAVPARTIGSRVAKLYPQLVDRVRQVNVGTFIEEDTVCFSDSSRLASVVLAHPLQRVSDFETFFRAVKALLVDGYQFMVVLMGSGPAEHRLRGLLARLELSQIVTIIPILDPWRSVIAAGDIFVQPQPLHAFSVFLLEAMSLGTAVAACMGGVDDLLVPNQTAVVFEPDNERSIRQALTRLLGEHDFARRLAKTAQEHVRAGYSVSQMVSTTVKAYADAQRQYAG